MSILFAKRLNLLAVLRLTVNPIEILVIKYVFIVHRGVREEMNFVRLSHDIVTFDVDRDVSTAVESQAMRSIVYVFMWKNLRNRR